MDTLDIDILIEGGLWPEGLEPGIRRAVQAAIAGSGRMLAGPAEISIVLTNDAHQKTLNAQWRGMDKPTNVLSFPQIDPGDPVIGLLGDIIIAHETLMREAAALETSLEAHLTHLLVHGVLHILGYDHQTETEALAMEARETDIMLLLGFNDPYAGQDLDLDAVDRKTAQ